jgi:hypothetical protein
MIASLWKECNISELILPHWTVERVKELTSSASNLQWTDFLNFLQSPEIVAITGPIHSVLPHFSSFQVDLD